MKITYTGRQVELEPAPLKKIQDRVVKLGKLLDGKGEREAHVTVGLERGRHTAEITVNYNNHPLVGKGSDPDLFNAIHQAVEKLEKQAIKVRAKWRESKRKPRETLPKESPPLPAFDAGRNGSKRIFRVDNNQGHKPMTVDEALLEMEKDRQYLVYRDANSERLSVLMRRRDGNFDLIEC